MLGCKGLTLSAVSDQRLISLYNITPELHIKVMRVKEMMMIVSSLHMNICMHILPSVLYTFP